MGIEGQHRHWETISRNWSHVGYPLRPCPEDIENYTHLMSPPNRESIRALVLGVTPELYHLSWPAGSTVHSVDRSSAMTRAIWPGPAESASNADWRDLPFQDESFDCVVCDGGLHLLDYPGSQRVASASLARILKRGGQFIIRLFALPDPAECAATVLADLKAGKIPNIHILKLRMGMALQPSCESGIVLQHVYDKITGEFGGLDELQMATGWLREEVFTLSSYQLSTDRYHFITREQSIAILSSSGSLTLERCLESRYPLGERCPVLSFRKNHPHEPTFRHC